MKHFKVFTSLWLLVALFSVTATAQVPDTHDPEWKGLDMNVQEVDFVLAPNPGPGFFELVLNQELTIPAQVKVFMEKGGLILHGQLSSGSSGCRIDLTDYSPGNYIVVLEVGNATITRNFMLSVGIPEFH